MVLISPTPPVIPKGLDDLVRSDLESFRNIWFTRLLISTLVVVFGLLFELPEILHESFDAIRTLGHRPKMSEIAPWIKLSASIGWLLIVFGVSGEFVADGFVSKADGIVQTFDESMIAEAQRQTDLAKIRAGGAYERAAQTEKEAAQLREQAEAEHVARVKIEAAVAFRSLDDQQKQDIGTALTRFGSITSASIWFANGSAEAELFADDIAEALRSAHIHTTTVSGVMEMREGGSSLDAPIESADTGVDISSTINPVARELADTLFKELTSLGFDAKRQPDQKSQNNPPGPVIWVTVQARPKGPQGKYKLQAEQEAKAKRSAKSK